MEITIPFQYEPRPYQLEYHKTQKRFKVCVFHRRGGKSKMALNEQVRKTQIRKGIYYYFLPTYRQAKQVIWDELVDQHIPKNIVKDFNKSELAIYYRNGSIQRFVGCEDVNKHRGINAIDIVLDEYSEMNPELWTAILQPVLRENKGTATFIFTPKGRNHAWEILQTAKQHPNNWFYSIKDVDATGGISPEEMELAKSETPQVFIDQEYYCKFVDDASAFFRRIKENTYDADNFEVEQAHLFQLGVDIAKYHDWTVLTPFNLNTFKVGKQDRFNQIDWNLQKARIEASARRHNDARIIIDATGVGDPIVEDLQRQQLDIEPYKFNVTSRQQLLDNLAILLEQDKIKIPDDEGLIAELQSMSYRIKRKGRPCVSVPEGMHDDRIMSLALSVWGAKQVIKTNGEYSWDTSLYQTTYD